MSNPISRLADWLARAISFSSESQQEPTQSQASDYDEALTFPPEEDEDQGDELGHALGFDYADRGGHAIGFDHDEDEGHALGFTYDDPGDSNAIGSDYPAEDSNALGDFDIGDEESDDGE